MGGGGGGGGGGEELLPSPGELGEKIQGEEPLRDHGGRPGVGGKSLEVSGGDPLP